MIKEKDIKKILEGYDLNNITIASLGGHSALDICRGAKKYGFKTLVVCQKGREKTYLEYYRTNGKLGVVDEVIVLDKFSEITRSDIVKTLQKKNALFVHSRYFWVYCDFDKIENDFLVPIIGSREMLKLEERAFPKNQYYLLEKAGIRTPKRFSSPKDIDRLVIIKAAEAHRPYERSFFFANDFKTYKKNSQELVKKGIITQESLKSAIIEEYALGTQVNFNYFYSPITKKLELLGTDARRQTNIDGLMRLPSDMQLEVLKFIQPKYIENGHFSCTVKESLLESAFEMGERFVKAGMEEYPPGIIGPFALQGAFLAGPPKEEFVCFDVSLRMPGSPGTIFTPYTGYLFRDSISVGERIAIEVKRAIKTKSLQKILS